MSDQLICPTAPFQSKLIPYQKELFRMWYKERATLKMLQQWLDERNVTISTSGISRFIRCRRTHADPHEFPFEMAIKLSQGKKKAKRNMRMSNAEKNTSIDHQAEIEFLKKLFSSDLEDIG